MCIDLDGRCLILLLDTVAKMYANRKSNAYFIVKTYVKMSLDIQAIVFCPICAIANISFVMMSVACDLGCTVRARYADNEGRNPVNSISIQTYSPTLHQTTTPPHPHLPKNIMLFLAEPSKLNVSAA